MILPDVIEASLPKNDSTEGIISKFRNLNPNEEIQKVIVPSHINYDNGDINTLVYWNSGIQLRGDSAYFQLYFKDYHIFPLGYSFRGFNGKYFCTKWSLTGYDANMKNPIQLGINQSKNTNFCGTTSTMCNSNKWATFSIPQLQKTFSYLRWTRKESSEGNYFALGGIEVFGILSKTPKTSFHLSSNCFSSYSLQNNIEFHIITFISIFL